MSIIDFSQEDADELIAMEKHVENNGVVYDFPSPGKKIEIDLVSIDKREKFILDMSKGRINVKKIKYQNRAKKSIVLIRLDIDGPPHRNPDDEEIPSPHLHIYREGYGDKWAFPIKQEQFSNINDLTKTLDDFMDLCNITKKPILQIGLF